MTAETVSEPVLSPAPAPTRKRARCRNGGQAVRKWQWGPVRHLEPLRDHARAPSSLHYQRTIWGTGRLRRRGLPASHTALSGHPAHF